MFVVGHEPRHEVRAGPEPGLGPKRRTYQPSELLRGVSPDRVGRGPAGLGHGPYIERRLVAVSPARAVKEDVRALRSQGGKEAVVPLSPRSVDDRPRQVQGRVEESVWSKAAIDGLVVLTGDPRYEAVAEIQIHGLAP